MSAVGGVPSVAKTLDIIIVPAAVTCPVIFLVCLMWLVSLMLLTTLHFLVSLLLLFVRDPDMSAVAVPSVSYCCWLPYCCIHPCCCLRNF